MTVKYTTIFAEFLIVLLVPVVEESVKIPPIIQQPLSMIPLSCIICARVKYIQYKDIYHKGQVYKDLQTRSENQNRITHAIKSFWHVQP